MNSFKNDCLALFQNAICKVTKVKCGQVEWKYNGAGYGNTQVHYKYFKVVLDIDSQHREHPVDNIKWKYIKTS